MQWKPSSAFFIDVWLGGPVSFMRLVSFFQDCGMVSHYDLVDLLLVCVLPLEVIWHLAGE